MRFTGINFIQSMELLFRHMSAHSKGHCIYPPRNIKISKYSDRKKQAPCYLSVCVSGQMDCMRSLTEKILMQPALFHCVLNVLILIYFQADVYLSFCRTTKKRRWSFLQCFISSWCCSVSVARLTKWHCPSASPFCCAGTHLASLLFVLFSP